MSTTPDQTPDIGRTNTWHGTTSRTLRFVFTSPDHRPQRVAAAVVCAAAALVIFAVGRSPISGTANIGQATGSLSAERSSASYGEPGRSQNAPEAAPTLPVPADPASPSELATASGSDTHDELNGGSDVVPPPEPPGLAGEELAPGLVVPPSADPSARADAPNGDAAAPGNTAALGGAAPGGAAPGTAAPGNDGAAKVPRPAPSGPVAAPPPPRAPAKKPTAPASLPMPARKPTGELDFGI